MAGENDEGTNDDGSVEVEIEVGDEENKGGEGGAKGNGVAHADGGNLDDAVTKLRADLDAANRRAEAAEHSARTARAVAGQAGDEVRQGHLNVINAGIEKLKQDKLILRQNYAAALAENDHDKAAEINDLMSETNSKLLALETGKVNFENAAPQQSQQPQRTGDPVEDMANTLTPKSAAWVRAHPEYARDPEKTVAMIAAHNLARSIHKLENESPEYFAFVEKTLGIGSTDAPPAARHPVQTSTPASSEPLSAAARPATQPSPAAPSRGSRSTNTIRLTKDQIEAAKISGITPKEYAQNLIEEKKKGNVH